MDQRRPAQPAGVGGREVSSLDSRSQNSRTRSLCPRVCRSCRPSAVTRASIVAAASCSFRRGLVQPRVDLAHAGRPPGHLEPARRLVGEEHRHPQQHGQRHQPAGHPGHEHAHEHPDLTITPPTPSAPRRCGLDWPAAGPTASPLRPADQGSRAATASRDPGRARIRPSTRASRIGHAPGPSVQGPRRSFWRDYPCIGPAGRRYRTHHRVRWPILRVRDSTAGPE